MEADVKPLRRLALRSDIKVRSPPSVAIRRFCHATVTAIILAAVGHVGNTPKHLAKRNFLRGKQATKRLIHIATVEASSKLLIHHRSIYPQCRAVDVTVPI